ncbi:hypothetical protein [Micromonospora humidisoli]|uniref:Uncharacterized protein n=1 Tax=Micromonospora humidisoli TaxID=2807622 RepID=A0ABS2JAQ7_9ACTN|nr:hypothetical protein [Micromonospora humidisoli]MBM7083597.1 hypothetical protein [Micromonospora humidisoli]
MRLTITQTGTGAGFNLTVDQPVPSGLEPVPVEDARRGFQAILDALEASPEFSDGYGWVATTEQANITPSAS